MRHNYSFPAGSLKWFRLFAAAALCLGLAWAQTPTGAIEGTVTDPTGAVIPGAKVTVTEVATGRTIPLVTNEVGLYSIRNLVPGLYNIRIEASGMAVREIRNVAVSTGQVVNGSAAMEVGRTGEIVQVTAQAVTVDVSRQTVDTVVSEDVIKSVALFSRNFLDLAAFAPGAIVRDGGSIDPTKEVAYRSIGVAGRSGTATRVQVDGIDVTDEVVGTTVANYSQDAVHEFQVSQSSLDISTSLTSSGAINIISKSGSNEFHGNWFWDYYNQDMGARIDYQPKAVPLKRNRTGVSLGGPFVKDRLFYYVNWERHYQTGQEVFTAPLFPQLNTAQDFPIGIRYTSGRLDWRVSDSVRFFYRFNYDWNLSTGGSAVSPFQNVNWTTTDAVGLDFNTAHTTHAYRFGYVNFNNRIESQELKYKFLRTPNGIPYYLGVGQYAAGPNSLAPQATYQDNWQNSYDGSWLTGRHSVRYGFDVRRIILGGFANFSGPLSITGTYDEDTVAQLRRRGANLQDPLEYPFESFTMGPANGFFNLKPAHGLPHGGKFNTRLAWFVGDSIKASRQLTLNLGVRWVYDTGYFPNDKNVVRDPIVDRWIQGASNFSKMPKNLFSPSVGFAWNPKADGKTVIRGGFYRGYEMNILNNTMFDEFAFLPPGIGPDFYDHTYVTTPDGKPINVDGKHPDGDYSDLVGQPIKNIIGTAGLVQAALNDAYANYKFDPKSGKSAFQVLRGLTYGGIFPGDQYKIPYGLQFNIGVQRELTPGTVLSADYVFNHGVGLPNLVVDYERRRSAGTLQVAAARAQRDRVLAGKTVDEWIAANPTRNISAFGLISDTIFQGLYPDISRARFVTGGFTKYRGLQVQLRGSRQSALGLKNHSYVVSYALSRAEASATAARPEFLAGPWDNNQWNRKETFGPHGLDRTHMLRTAWFFTTPGGFQFNSFWQFLTATPQTLTVPNLGGAISGVQGFFGTDINGDGGVGTTPRADVLPGLNAGQYGRKVKSFKDLNQIISQFNSTYAGQLTPHGKALVSAGLFTEAQLKRLGAVIPTIPLVPETNPYPWHNLFRCDLRLVRPIKISKVRESLVVLPSVDFLNLFNHAPHGSYGGLGRTFGSLNYDYAKGAPGLQESDLYARVHRITETRRIQIGVRVEF